MCVSGSSKNTTVFYFATKTFTAVVHGVIYYSCTVCRRVGVFVCVSTCMYVIKNMMACSL